MELPASAGTITFNTKTRQVLMIKVKSPSTGKIYWSFPKGEIENREKPQQTAIRETFEETGIKPEIIRKVGDFEIYRQYKGVKFHKRVIMYAAFSDNIKPKPGNEVLDAKWVDFDKAFIALKQHETDYISSLLLALNLFAKRFPHLYEIK